MIEALIEKIELQEKNGATNEQLIKQYGLKLVNMYRTKKGMLALKTK